MLGKTAVVLPTGCPWSVGLVAAIGQTKSQSPLFPEGGGKRSYKLLVHKVTQKKVCMTSTGISFYCNQIIPLNRCQDNMLIQ